MEIRIALAGNPNSGKTTLFNALTGANQFVGNWPGVTVEKKEGRLKGEKDVIITDLPGIYSLSPYTMEEVVARNVLIDQRPDALLNIIDATNLERNLYLTTQLAELGIPMVIALNMMDVVRKNGDRIDTGALSSRLGMPVVEISALREDGVMEAAQRAVQLARSGKKPIPMHSFSGSVEHALAHIEEAVLHDMPAEQQRWFAVKIFERDERVLKRLELSGEKLAHIEQDIRACEAELDDDAQSLITAARYTYIASIVDGCLKKSKRGMSTSDRIDQVMTNRILGLPIFAAIMVLVYYISVTTVGAIVTDWTNDVFVGEWIVPAAQSFFEGIGCAEWLTGLIVDGVISGVGAVIGFVPQMLVLFLMLCILEDCGYMARVAFIMDRIFRRFGLSGKSFIPMLVGTGCGVPGIMASRTIEQERDRRMTIMTTTFIPCGAKMPIIALMAGAIFGGAWWVAPSAYFVGIAAIVLSGIILKKTKPFAGEPALFVMELPAYHMPTVKNVLRGTWERGWSFIKKAGTIILLSTILVWFTTYFGFVDETFRMLAEEEIDSSLLAAIGNAIAWIFRPLGWGNWQATVASITGLVAKENIVGTMGILYRGGDGTVYANIASAFTGITAYSFLVFNLLCAPCFAAIGAIKREMNNARWTWFAIGYQCGFAYVVALMINQFGNLFTGHANVIGLIFAAAFLVGMIYMLARPYHEATKLETKVKA
ncbi:MAG: ferrous iron transport protein B [Clostridiales bacterium]|nr:ferrous iron transport protein B [Clostridiales bacterium]MDY5515851.1 ferrous iron transport protein B [Candidatus Ventricola sp.]